MQCRRVPDQPIQSFTHDPAALIELRSIFLIGAKSTGNGALRLTTARYYTPAGRSIQAKGIVPDIESLQEVPEDVKARSPEIRGESLLRGHLKGDGEEQGGSESYVHPEPKDDKALNLALDLMRGVQAHWAFPPNAKTANLPH